MTYNNAKLPRVQLTFACGASYPIIDEAPRFPHVDKLGRGRMAVYDTENPGGSPGLELIGIDHLSRTIVAPCLDCPCKTKAKRNEERARRSDGRLFPSRIVITCYATPRAV